MSFPSGSSLESGRAESLEAAITLTENCSPHTVERRADLRDASIAHVFFFCAFFVVVFFSAASETRQEPPLRERAVDTAACQQETLALAVSSCLALCSGWLVSVHQGFAGHTSGSFCTSDLINIIVQCRVQTYFYIQTMYPQALSAASAAQEEKGPDKKVLCVALNCFSDVFPFRPCVESLLPASEARQEPPLRERAVDTAACQQAKIALAVSSCLALCSALLVSVHEGFARHARGSFCTSELINIIVQCPVQTVFYIQTMYPQAFSAASTATEEKGPDKKVLCVAFNCFSHVFPFRPCGFTLASRR